MKLKTFISAKNIKDDRSHWKIGHFTILETEIVHCALFVLISLFLYLVLPDSFEHRLAIYFQIVPGFGQL